MTRQHGGGAAERWRLADVACVWLWRRAGVGRQAGGGLRVYRLAVWRVAAAAVPPVTRQPADLRRDLQARDAAWARPTVRRRRASL